MHRPRNFAGPGAGKKRVMVRQGRRKVQQPMRRLALGQRSSRPRYAPGRGTARMLPFAPRGAPPRLPPVEDPMRPPLAAALFAVALAASPGADAQSAAGTSEVTDVKALRAQAKTPADKKALVASTLALTDTEAKRFWPVYDAFQRKLDATNRRYSLAIQEAVMADRISDLHARNLAKELTDIEDAEARARKTLYSAIVRALPGRKAIRYLQLESKLQSGYRYEVASTLPLVQ